MSTLRVNAIQNTSGVDNQGKIIQVVYANDAVGQYSSGSNSFLDTGWSVTITPKFANSKILIDVSARSYSSAHYSYLDIYRNGTTSLTGSTTTGNGLAGPIGYQPGGWQQHTFFYEDSPNTTSAVTYNLYGKTVSGTFYVGFDSTVIYPNGVYMTATEIAQ